jgi:hypothetical protein
VLDKAIDRVERTGGYKADEVAYQQYREARGIVEEE